MEDFNTEGFQKWCDLKLKDTNYSDSAKLLLMLVFEVEKELKEIGAHFHRDHICHFLGWDRSKTIDVITEVHNKSLVSLMTHEQSDFILSAYWNFQIDSLLNQN
jgi:hypothetical protein